MKKLLLFFSIMGFSLSAMDGKREDQRGGIIARLQMLDPDNLADTVDEFVLGEMTDSEKGIIKTCECMCQSSCALVGISAAYCGDYNSCAGLCWGCVGGRVVGNATGYSLVRGRRRAQKVFWAALKDLITDTQLTKID